MTRREIACSDYELLRASDEPHDLALAEAHAALCARCRTVAEAQTELEQRVESWALEIEPPKSLEGRVRAGVAEELATMRPRRAHGHWFLVAAASFLIAVAGLTISLWLPAGGAPDRAERLLVAEALAAAERAERDHARAIARLKTAAATVLARCEDPETPAAEAARLLSLRDRLSSLDATIAEIQTYLEGNPANPAARTVLLAAYNDQTETLRRVMALGEQS